MTTSSGATSTNRVSGNFATARSIVGVTEELEDSSELTTALFSIAEILSVVKVCLSSLLLLFPRFGSCRCGSRGCSTASNAGVGAGSIGSHDDMTTAQSIEVCNEAASFQLQRERLAREVFASV